MEVSCPISAERVNENVIRIIALMVVIIAVGSALYLNFYAMVLLTIDFAIRAFTNGKLSVLKLFALNLVKALSITNKMTDLAPKKFAATLGFAFCLLISLCYLFSFFYAALVLTLILIVFALLESVFAICVGCYVYSFWNTVFRKN